MQSEIMDLFKFPFLAEVWGTAADWTMVIVTAGTLYLLIKTLRSQLEVQKAQQKTTLIESERYAKEFMPLFELQKDHVDTYVDQGNLVIDFQLLIILKEGTCINLTINMDNVTDDISFTTIFPVYVKRASAGSEFKVSGSYTGYEMTDTTHDLWV
jgi:hypothetical protein